MYFFANCIGHNAQMILTGIAKNAANTLFRRDVPFVCHLPK